jgi:hypothetical protein
MGKVGAIEVTLAGIPPTNVRLPPIEVTEAGTPRSTCPWADRASSKIQAAAAALDLIP